MSTEENIWTVKSMLDWTEGYLDRKGDENPRFSAQWLLSEATGLSRETIKNMRNDPNRNFPIQEVVAVAIALHLPPDLSKEYFRRAPSNFLDTEEMYCYQYAANEWYKLPVAEVNRRLVEMGKKPLTNLVAGYDENGVKMEDSRSWVG